MIQEKKIRTRTRDSNSQPFDHVSGSLTNKLSRLPPLNHSQHTQPVLTIPTPPHQRYPSLTFSKSDQLQPPADRPHRYQCWFCTNQSKRSNQEPFTSWANRRDETRENTCARYLLAVASRLVQPAIPVLGFIGFVRRVTRKARDSQRLEKVN